MIIEPISNSSPINFKSLVWSRFFHKGLDVAIWQRIQNTQIYLYLTDLALGANVFFMKALRVLH